MQSEDSAMTKTCLLAGALLVVAAHSAGAGPVPKEQALQLMTRPGSWIEADGVMQADGTLLGKDLEVYSPGDTAELEEPAIYGAVTALNRTKSTMRVLGYIVTWDATTTFKDENKRQILSSKLQDGIGVKIQGELQSNGTFKASKIKLQDKRIKKDKIKIKEKIFGPVTVLDARSGALRVLNTPVSLAGNATFVEVEITAAAQ
jgi:hypothetical protein